MERSLLLPVPQARLSINLIGLPLALTLLPAELYNILAFHLTLAPASIPPALVASVLWILVFLQYSASFKGVRAEKSGPEKWPTLRPDEHGAGSVQPSRRLLDHTIQNYPTERPQNPDLCGRSTGLALSS